MQTIISIILLNFFALFLHKRTKLTPSAALLCSLLVAVVFLCITGIFGALFVGAIIFFAACAGVFVFEIYKKSDIRTYFSFTVIITNITCLVFFIIYIIQSPVFYYWDEYLLWGNYSSAMHAYNNLPNFHAGITDNYSDTAVTGALLSYILQFFGSVFEHWAVYFAYSVLCFFTLGTVAEYIFNKTKGKSISIITYLFFLLLPFFQQYHIYSADYTSISYAYATAMVDYLLAILCVAAVILYFACKQKPFYLLAFLALVLCKDIGVFFAIISALIIAVFELFASDKKVIKRLVSVIISFTVIVVSFLGWNVFAVLADDFSIDSSPKTDTPIALTDLDYYAQQTDNEVEADPQSYNSEKGAKVRSDETIYDSNYVMHVNNYKISLYSAVHLSFINVEQLDISASQITSFNIVKSLITSLFMPFARAPEANNALSQFISSIFNFSTYLYIKDIYLIVGLILLGILTAVFAQKKKRMAAILTTAVFIVGFYVYLMFMSAIVATFNDGMVEYGRYFMPYYTIWIFVAITIFICTAKKYLFFINIGAVGVVLVMLFSLYTTGLDKTIIAAPDNVYGDFKIRAENIQNHSEILTKGTNIYSLQKPENTMENAFISTLMHPAYINNDINQSGFNFNSYYFANEKLVPDDVKPYYIIATDEEFIAVVKENFDYIYTAYLNEEFVQSYDDLFEGGLEYDVFYAIADNGDFPFMRVKVE